MVYKKETDEQRQERRHEEDLRRLQRLRPIDDTFMRGLFRDNLPLAQMVLRILTGKEDLVLTKCKTQEDMKRVTGARSVCLDVYGTDSMGRKFDLEIQRADEGARLRRARYHASVLDIENLDAGQKFEELPDTYVIFITENDIFEKGRSIYILRTVDEATKETMEDGRHILYVNGTYRGEDAIGKLMHDFSCTDAKDMHYKLMAERTRYLKEHPEGVKSMCKEMEQLRNESLEEGRAEEKRMIATNMYKAGIPIEQISSIVKMEEEEIRQWIADNEAVL